MDTAGISHFDNYQNQHRLRRGCALLFPLLLAEIGCASPGGLSPGGHVLRTASLAVRLDPDSLRWRVEDLRAPEGGGRLLESRIAIETDPAGAGSPGGRRATASPEAASEHPLGPARTRVVTLAGDASRPGIEIAFTLLENRPVFAVTVSVRNTTPAPLAVRRIVPAELDATHASVAAPGVAPSTVPGAIPKPPAVPDPARCLLSLHPALSRDVPRTVEAGVGITHAGATVTAAIDPASSRTLAAGFPSTRQGSGLLRWRVDPAPADKTSAPSLRFGAEADLSSRRLAPEERIVSDELLLVWDAGPWPALEAFAAAARAASRPRTAASPLPAPNAATGVTALPTAEPSLRPISGWSSGHALQVENSEDAVLRNADLASRHLREAGLSMILVGDGWQRAAGDWEPNARFPGGHRRLTDRIHALGLKAGLWIAPFLAAEKSPVAMEHPDWVVRDADGRPHVNGDVPAWGGRFHVLDVTRPDVRARLADLCRRATAEWGYDAVRLDHLERAFHGAVRAQPGNPAPAYALALEAMREACGPGRLVLGGDAPLGPSWGRVDAMRIVPDDAPAWPGLMRTASAAAGRRFLHGQAWMNDAGTVTLRPPMSDDESLARATLAAFFGAAAWSGDPLDGLPPERLALLQRMLPLPAAAARPVDLFDAARRSGPSLRPAGDGPAIPLPSVWRFRPGDQPHWKEPAADDADWPQIPVPGNWKENGFPAHDGYAWYRTRFPTPSAGGAAEWALDLGRVDDVDAVYINGEMVGSTGRFPPDYDSRWSEARRYPVPARLLRPPADAAENLLAVRVYSQVGPAGIVPAGPEPPPAVWHLPVDFGGEPADLALLVNWGGEPARIEAPLARIVRDAAATRVVYDATEDRLLDGGAAPGGPPPASVLPPRSSRLLVVRPAAGRPQVVGTSRHLLPGTMDLERVTWDAPARALRGVSKGLLSPASRPPGLSEPAYAVTVHVPPGFTLARATAAVPCVAVRAGRELVRLEFPDAPAERMEWTIRFEERP